MIRTLVHPVIWLGVAMALTTAAPPAAQAQDTERRRKAIAESLKRIRAQSRPAARPTPQARPVVPNRPTPTSRPSTPRSVERVRPQTRRPVLERGATSRPEVRRPVTQRPIIRRPEPQREIGGTITRGTQAREATPPSGVADYRTRSSAGPDRVAEYRPDAPAMSPDWIARPDTRRETVRERDRRATRGSGHRGWYPRRHRYYHRPHHHRRFGHRRHFHRFGGFRFHSGHWHFVIVLGGPRVIHDHHHHYHHAGTIWWDGSRTTLRDWDRSYARRVGARSYDFTGVTCVELRLRTNEGEEHRIEIDPRRWNANDPGDLYAALWAQLDREGYVEIEGLDGVLHVFPEGLLQEIEASACY